jgi:hypothetical protein
MEVVIGVDPHKATNAAVAIDEHGELVGQAAFPANRGGIRALERWAKRFAEGSWEILRLLTERREDLVAERTRALNRLTVDAAPTIAKCRTLN